MSDNLKAGGLMMLGVTLLALNDAIAKTATGTLSVAAVLFYRGLWAIAITCIALKLSGLTIISRDLGQRWVFARGCLETLGTVVFVTSLSLLPIGLATTLVFTSPMLLTLIAAFVLRERVGWRRFSAVFAGFAGVILVSGIGTQHWTSHAVWPLCVALCVAFRDLATRKVDARIHTLHVVLLTAVMVTVAGAIGMPTPLESIQWTTIAMLGVGAALLCGSYYCYISAVRLGELSFVAPLVYVGILVALALGVVVWGDELRVPQLLGTVLIIGSGVVILARERRTAK